MSEQFVKQITGCDEFENSIRKFGIVAACEWFGYKKDDQFTIETIQYLDEQLKSGETQ